MVLEELKESYSALLDDDLDLPHQFVKVCLSFELPEGLVVSLEFVSFKASLWRSGLLDEFKVLDVSFGVSEDLDDGLLLLIGHWEEEASEDLSKLLGRHFVVIVEVPRLEEGLGVKSLSDDLLLESLNYFICNLSLSVELFLGRSSIEGLGSPIANRLVNVHFKVLCGEGSFNSGVKVSPSDVAFLASEVITDHVELLSGQVDLAHVESDSELRACHLS